MQDNLIPINDEKSQQITDETSQENQKVKIIYDDSIITDYESNKIRSDEPDCNCDQCCANDRCCRFCCLCWCEVFIQGLCG